MAAGPSPSISPDPLVEREARAITRARYATFGLAAAFLVLATVGAVVMRLVDATNYPSYGLAFWWALQTVTTVGYGDLVPTTAVGRVVGGFEMVIGISIISLLTAAVTSTVIQREQESERRAAELRHRETLRTMNEQYAELSRRLDELQR